MRMTRVHSLAALLLLVVMVASACTSDDEPMETLPPSASPSLVPVADGYVYRGPGVEATLDLDGGTFRVFNSTGRALPEPGLYLLDARDGGVIDVVVEASAPVPDGQTAQFQVEASTTIEARHVGLVVLLFGEDDYGAFVPAAGDPA